MRKRNLASTWGWSDYGFGDPAATLVLGETLESKRFAGMALIALGLVESIEECGGKRVMEVRGGCSVATCNECVAHEWTPARTLVAVLVSVAASRHRSLHAAIPLSQPFMTGDDAMKADVEGIRRRLSYCCGSQSQSWPFFDRKYFRTIATRK